MISVPPEIEAILAALRGAGFEAYPVGGCVRDSLLGLTPGDWDVATSARPEQVIALFGEENTIPTGLKHGTVTVRSGGSLSEVTTFRADGDYGDHRRPDAVRFVSSLEEDLSRRDFTVNAMALDASDRVIDPFGGRQDLKKKCIRCVGLPEVRFREDALRILRALRFAARLGFSIEPATGEAMLSCRSYLPGLSRERIYGEVKGFLSAPAPGALAKEFAPVLASSLPPLDSKELAEAAPGLDAAPDFALRLALLCRRLDKAWMREFLDGIRADNETKRRAAGFHAALDARPETREELLPLLRQLGRKDAALLAALPGREGFARLLAESSEADLPGSLKELAVNGNDLLALGAQPGPMVRNVLDALMEDVWQGRAENSRPSLLFFAEHHLRGLIDSYGAVVFRETASGPEILMIYHRKGWGFPKGHPLQGESETVCAAREVREETGVEAEIDPGFRRETVSERPGDKRKVVFFLGHYASGKPVPQPGETRAAAWFPAAEAAEQVYFPGDREICRAAWEYYRSQK